MKDFTILIYNDNQEYLSACLDNIARQIYDLSSVEVIIGTLPLDAEQKQHIAKLGMNCEIKEYDRLSRADFYRYGSEHSSGRILNFTDSFIMMQDPKTLQSVIKKAGVTGVVVCGMQVFYDGAAEPYVKYILSAKREECFNVEQNPVWININLQSYFIDRDLLREISFDPSFGIETGVKFLVDLYGVSPAYYNLGSVSLVSLVPFEDNTAQNAIQYDKNWYIGSLGNWIRYAESCRRLPMYAQEIIMYLIYTKFNCNSNDRNKNILSFDEVDMFFETTVELLRHIDDNILLQTKYDGEYRRCRHRFRIPRPLKYYLYKRKRDKDYFTFVSGDVLFESHENVNIPVSVLTDEKINVYAINQTGGRLVFDCTVGIQDYLENDDIKIKILYGKREIPVRRTGIFKSVCEFGKTVNEEYTFQFGFDAGESFDTLRAFLLYGGKEYLLKFNFVNIQSRLNNSRRSYWNAKGFTVRNCIDALAITKQSKFKTAVSEFMYIISRLANERGKLRVLKLCILRLLYYFTRPFLKNRHIWLTFDKLYKGGDNGEYVFRYGRKHGINIYYIIKKDSPDYKRLSKEYRKNLLVFNSLKAKLYALHAEVILKTHANILGFLGFDGVARIVIAGLFNAEIMEIQHGLTLQDIPQYQNRIVDNIKLYFVASPYELQNVRQEVYGFDEEQIRLVGLARYDGLKDKSRKMILITPTWRHSITSPSLRHGTPRTHNDIFKKSEYFKIYNSLINNERLITCAKNNGYRIIYLLHPTISAQKEDFDKNGFVEVVGAAGDMSYEDILTEASLMVTDYSGVQYDFAYMRKPLLYYHPDALPPHYEAGMMNYETMGFGAICKTEKALVDQLCEYMENGCKIKPEYRRRAEEFFAFDDYDNCKRICDDVSKYLENV